MDFDCFIEADEVQLHCGADQSRLFWSSHGILVACMQHAKALTGECLCLRMILTDDRLALPEWAACIAVRTS